MSFNNATSMLKKYEFHTSLIHHFINGVSHQESVWQLPFEHNCMNWILGHIVANRSHVLETVATTHSWQGEICRFYHDGAPAITPSSDCLDFATLLNHLDESVSLLAATLESMDDSQIAESHRNYRGEMSRFDHLKSFHWHEGFHIGQLEMLKAFIESER